MTKCNKSRLWLTNVLYALFLMFIVIPLQTQTYGNTELRYVDIISITRHSKCRYQCFNVEINCTCIFLLKIYIDTRLVFVFVDTCYFLHYNQCANNGLLRHTVMSLYIPCISGREDIQLKT
jgi:hypothetical protein